MINITPFLIDEAQKVAAELIKTQQSAHQIPGIAGMIVTRDAQNPQLTYIYEFEVQGVKFYIALVK